MKQIPLERVNKDNTNIRKYSDSLWRELRKERYKKANPDSIVNEMAAEQQAHHDNTHSDFNTDVDTFIATYLKAREAYIFRLFLYGGKIRQSDIGDIVGVSQSTVTNTLMGIPPKGNKPGTKGVLQMFREYYYTDEYKSSDIGDE